MQVMTSSSDGFNYHYNSSKLDAVAELGDGEEVVLTGHYRVNNEEALLQYEIYLLTDKKQRRIWVDSRAITLLDVVIG